jgi:predicted transcriptional regulator
LAFFNLSKLKNRSRSDIVCQILEAANDDGENDEGITLTKLMYNVVLCNEQMKEYLALLIDDGLITYDSTMSTFKTTEKGLTLLQAYNQLDKMLKGQQI